MHRECVPPIASAQHGAFTRAQARAAGISDRAIDGAVARREWRLLRRGVYAAAPSPDTDQQRLMAVVLAAGEGALASHLSAAWLWGLHADLQLAVTVPLGRAPRLAGVMVHRRATPVASRRQAIPVTNPLRTVLDLGSLGAGPVEQAIDRGLASQLFTIVAVEAELERLAGRGRNGVRAVRAALDRRLAAEQRTPSVLESRFGRLVRAAGLPRPAAEYPVLEGAYRLDFAWPEVRVAVEVDGYRHHSSWGDFQHDRRRQNDLVLAGWTVLRFTWDDVCHRPAVVAGAVGSALAASRSA